MRNVFWLREGVIGGRSGPNRDVWSPNDLAAGGVGAVLSVNDGELVHVDDLAAVGIDHCQVPLPDAAPPQPGDLESCVRALPRGLSFVRQAIDARRRVIVHCSSGKDRTGLFLSYFLCATEGLTPSAAIREVRRVRPIALSADGWETFAHDVLAACGFAGPAYTDASASVSRAAEAPDVATAPQRMGRLGYAMRIEVDDVSRPQVLALLEEHLRNMHEVTPPGQVFAFDAAKLRAPGVTFWTAWNDEVLLGCAALKELSALEGEVKSMRTPAAFRRQGVGRTLLDHVLQVARERGYRRVFLETGNHPAFEPAQALYRSAGFRECGPFGEYEHNGFSVFMSLPLDGGRGA